ncbi:MAG TPA: GlsB/YeaQ/YmgE family stress response membrane protein [Candidatus Binatia bacterium]|nr:GlsB/YeaQ/YmgE family stress response membrane protein [Candidatus Binatia bacterium]
MGWIAWIIFGLIAGLIAKLLMPGRDPGGFIVTIIIGILGAVVGGYIGSALNLGAVTGFNLVSFALAVLGSIILLFIYRLIKAR